MHGCIHELYKNLGTFAKYFINSPGSDNSFVSKYQHVFNLYLVASYYTEINLSYFLSGGFICLFDLEFKPKKTTFMPTLEAEYTKKYPDLVDSNGH